MFVFCMVCQRVPDSSQQRADPANRHFSLTFNTVVPIVPATCVSMIANYSGFVLVRWYWRRSSGSYVECSPSFFPSCPLPVLCFRPIPDSSPENTNIQGKRCCTTFISLCSFHSVGGKSLHHRKTVASMRLCSRKEGKSEISPVKAIKPVKKKKGVYFSQGG